MQRRSLPTRPGPDGWVPPTQWTAGRFPARAKRALDAMQVVAEFAATYAPGESIPLHVWDCARIMSDYLGHPQPEQWLWRWLNRARMA